VPRLLHYDVTTIKSVVANEDGYSITREDGWSQFVSKKECEAADIIPKIGMALESYGGIGQTIRGVCINGVTIFFKSELQVKREREAWIAETRKAHKKEYTELMEKIRNEPQRITADISGMGGGYERACQLMLAAGVGFLSCKPDFIWDYKEYKGVYGIAWSDSPDAKALDAVLMKACDNDCSGAMHQAVIGHLRHIHLHGHTAWLEGFKPDRLYVYPRELPAPSF
jgi:hypothetical protein